MNSKQMEEVWVEIFYVRAAGAREEYKEMVHFITTPTKIGTHCVSAMLSRPHVFMYGPWHLTKAP